MALKRDENRPDSATCLMYSDVLQSISDSLAIALQQRVDMYCDYFEQVVTLSDIRYGNSSLEKIFPS